MRHRVAAVGLALAATVLVHACGESPTGLSRDRAPENGSPEIGLMSIAPDKVCGAATTRGLIGNAGLPFGTVTVSNDEDQITVVYASAGDWELAETHLAVASSVADIPVSPSGSPQVGRFPYTARHAPGTATFAVSLSLDDLGVQAGDGLVVAAHADIVDRNDPQDPDDDHLEGAWGDGTPFPRRGRGDTGSYSEHVVQGCTAVTQTIGEEGGTVEVEGESEDEGVTLVIPRGALEEPVEITIVAVPLSEIQGAGPSVSLANLIEGTAYDFGPDGLQFLEPVEIIIGYDESGIGPDPETALSVFLIGEDIERLASTVDEEANEVTALIHHFTFYAAGTDGGGGLSFRETVGVTDHVSIDVRSPGHATVAEVIGVTDRVTVNVRSPGRSRVAEAIGVTDQVTIAVHSAIRSAFAEQVAITDDVMIDVRSPIRPSLMEAVGVTDDVTITVEPATAGGFAYVALQGADSVAVLDRATNTILTKISVGSFPYAVAVRPDGSEVYVTNRGDGSVSVIDVATQAVVATITRVATDPIDIAFSQDGSTAYVVDNDASLIGVIDAATRTVATHLTGSTRLARAIALTGDGTTAYVAAVDSLVVFDLVAGTAVDTISGTFSSGDVTLTPGDAEVWLTNVANHQVLVFERATLAVAATVSGIAAPEGIVIEGGGMRAYVAGGGFNVTPIDVATRTAGATIGLSFEPDALAVSADGSRAYVSAGRLGTELAVVDLTTGTVVTTLAVGSSPAEVGLTP